MCTSGCITAILTWPHPQVLHVYAQRVLVCVFMSLHVDFNMPTYCVSAAKDGILEPAVAILYLLGTVQHCRCSLVGSVHEPFEALSYKCV